MRAYDLAIQNFSVAEHLLQLHQLFRELRDYDPGKEFALAVCERLELKPESALHHAKNNHLLCGISATIPLPSCLLVKEGMDFLLRQAVLVASSAIESYFWDTLRENALTVIKAKGRKADSSLRDITLTVDDYLSLEGYADPDERLRQIILKRFERGTIYDFAKIEEIASILTVRDFWGEVAKQIGLTPSELQSRLNNLINRRNKITHRADRPDEDTKPEEIDSHGLRAMSHAWASTHITTAKSFVMATDTVINKTIAQLEQIIAQRVEQQLAQKTLKLSAHISGTSTMSGTATLK
jgi:hypothetical protein